MEISEFSKAAEVIASARHGVAFTGAGISVDSGIPDFRSEGGLWSRFDPAEYGTLQAFLTDPEKVWKMVFDLLSVLEPAKPNPGHEALARLEQLGKLSSVITQNVDNLHQEAGNKNVVEIHGNNKRLVCIGCGSNYALKDILEPSSKTVPKCPECGRILKPDVVFFGEALPLDAMQQARQQAVRADVMLVVGTSATVAPANLVPQVAKTHGAVIIEVNLETSELTDTLTDIFLSGSASEVLPKLVGEVESII
ncbi:MAG: NAD-dependent deacylase [Deltaproteobacteria bacterium]|nr:NAD-dependent deacylase [Deltaproteobacteria bacterium]